MTTPPNRSQYFARTVVFAKRGGGVALVDMQDTKVTHPLEQWLGRVLLLADGSHTVQELIDFVGQQYGGSPPATLEATIDSVITRLHDSNIIAFSDEAVALPYYLALPADEQDPEKANRLMQEDGFEQGSPTLL
jgi:hypothetical protein